VTYFSLTHPLTPRRGISTCNHAPVLPLTRRPSWVTNLALTSCFDPGPERRFKKPSDMSSPTIAHAWASNEPSTL
jgi:hypothetical protein